MRLLDSIFPADLYVFTNSYQNTKMIVEINSTPHTIMITPGNYNVQELCNELEYALNNQTGETGFIVKYSTAEQKFYFANTKGVSFAFFFEDQPVYDNCKSYNTYNKFSRWGLGWNLGFNKTNSYLRNCKTFFTGTPLRDQFYKSNPLPEWVPKGKGPLLIVMGGSQGAIAINEILYDSLEILMKKKFRIVHIIGEHNQYAFNEKNYKNYVQKKFTNEIAALIQNCDLVISRSGAGTINELMEAEKPSILIPYPDSKNNHQEKNAMILATSGGSVLINQNKISKEVFEETLERIFKIKSKKGKKHYEILDLMRKNMENNNKIKSKNEIKKYIDYFLKEF